MRLTRTSDARAKRVRVPRRFGLSPAALCAAAIAGCVVAVLGAANARSYGQSETAAAAAIAAAALLVSVLVAILMARRKSRAEAALWRSAGEQQAGDEAASLRRRRAILEQRLHVDAPHLCSQYAIPCTCWSFCASTQENSAADENELAAGQAPARVRKLAAAAQGLPLVHRSGMDSCPFRFASLGAPSASADDAAPDFPAAGAARR